MGQIYTKMRPYCLLTMLMGENIIANPLLVLFSRQMRDYLSGFQEQCDAILNDVNSALQHQESLQKQYLFVSNKTGTLHEACEQLLKEQVIGNQGRDRVSDESISDECYLTLVFLTSE